MQRDAPGFDELVAPRPGASGQFSVDVPDTWQQGRGAFGGLVVAMLIRAAEAVADDPSRPLRSLTAEIVGPVQPGEAAIAAEILRAGTGVSAVALRLVQGGDVQAHAVATLGKARPTYAAPPALPAPEPPSWRARDPLPGGHPLAPTFAQHFEFWPTAGLPLSGARPDGVLETAGWVRLRRPGRLRDVAFIAAHIDSYWPSFVAAATVPRVAATLTFAMETVGDLDGLHPDAPLFYRARMLGGRDGYAIEARELWGEDGRLVALNQQVFVVMK